MWGQQDKICTWCPHTKNTGKKKKSQHAESALLKCQETDKKHASHAPFEASHSKELNHTLQFETQFSTVWKWVSCFTDKLLVYRTCLYSFLIPRLTLISIFLFFFYHGNS
jgi:hypothetical protein